MKHCRVRRTQKDNRTGRSKTQVDVAKIERKSRPNVRKFSTCTPEPLTQRERNQKLAEVPPNIYASSEYFGHHKRVMEERELL